MSNPAHIWLTDENGSPIVGGCLIPARLGSIELKSLSHNVNIPVDQHMGKLTGTRIHSPIIMQKEFDQTTPILFRALCEGRTLQSAIIKMYHILDAGIESEYFHIILENVKITSISPYLLPNGMTSTHIENIELRYQAITWKNVEGNIIYKDTWNERMTA
ncbi:Hcp family type VI secretion system effector [Rahnella victoriana]|uniref:Hcp family type VI secretion system effector n=1 Tax=Rahnella victoriana TaxID=1510570 RepID=UPI001039A389|nr:type VI secretion system tube protein TssD [Rahnella victoriana]TBX32470.1 type VI secretion system tube protein Hcp [Rahnella victoriana]UHM91998.1 type VI secretion system tube protein Hcp [Rahnella victoriana]